jgi:radical SAM superfamily enzyme YgiQ (UPF0313 family)
MKILIVNPTRFDGKYCLREECCFGTSKTDLWVPGLLSNIAGMLKMNKYDHDFVDLNENPNESIDFKDYDYVIATIMSETALEQDLDLLKKAKADGCFTIAIINDPYNSGAILRTHKFIDYTFNNYREDMLRIFFDDVIKRKISNFSKTTFYKADYTGLNLSNYNKAIILTGRGCNYNCAFCHWKQTGHFNKPIQMVYNEIKQLKNYNNIKEFYLLDLNLTTDRRYVYELCRKIKPLDISWVCDGRVNEVDSKLLKAMKKAGCRMITYGIESADNDILFKIRKGFTIEHAIEKINLTVKSGIVPYCCFIIGFPWDNQASLKNLEKAFAKINRSAIMSFNLLRPLPGTDIFEVVKKNKLLLNSSDMKRGSGVDTWENKPSCKTLYLSADELTTFRKKMLKKHMRGKLFNLNSLKAFMESKDKLKLIKKVLS